MTKRLLIAVIVLALVAVACSSEPETCAEAADETVVLMQDLIDEVEAEFEEMSVQDFIALIAAGEDLPSVVAFEERAETLSERMVELGCTQEQLEEAVAARTDRLEATTPIGQFLLEAIRSGGL